MLQDLRHALRLFRKRTGFAVLTVLTLSLGIGATTAIFSVVDAALFRKAPYARPHELVSVWNTYPGWRGHEVLDRWWDKINLSWPEFERWREHQTSFSNVAVHGLRTMALTGSGTPQQLRVGLISPSLFELLGTAPAMGRGFRDDEAGFGAPPVAIVSHRLWADRLGAAPDAVGETIYLDDRPYDVVGVLPAGFRFRPISDDALAADRDVWLPVGGDGAAASDLSEGDHQFEGIARLLPGVTLETASGETAGILRGGRDPAVRGARVIPRLEAERGAARAPLLLLLGSVGLLMAVACTNVATVWLGEIAGRGGEFATRAAIGAKRSRLARQLVTESVLLGAVGAVGGLVVARLGVALLLRFAPPDIPLPATLGLDLRALGFSCILGVLTGIAFGLLPALRAGRTDLSGALRRGAQAVGSGGGGSQQLLIVAEVAAALVLLVSAGLLARSLATVSDVDPGFSSADKTIVALQLPGARYAKETDVSRFVLDLRERLEGIPGVTRVGGTSILPFSGIIGSSSFEIEGRPVPDGEKKPEGHRQSVLPGFHEMMRIPVLEGRGFDATDRMEAPSVTVVSESLARKYWPDRSPLGERLLRDGRSWEIVGVVGDILHSDLAGAPEPTFYLPFHQQPEARINVVLETPRAPRELASTIREAVWALDAGMPVPRIDAFDALMRRSVADERYRTFLVSIFGLAAALLTAVGIFGVTARAVAARRRELAIRLALGAPAAAIVRTTASREAAALAAGLGLGLILSIGTTRFLGGFLFGVDAFDPVAWSAALSLLAAIGLLAAWLPARRTLRLDPNRVLRE